MCGYYCWICKEQDLVALMSKPSYFMVIKEDMIVRVKLVGLDSLSKFG